MGTFYRTLVDVYYTTLSGYPYLIYGIFVCSWLRMDKNYMCYNSCCIEEIVINGNSQEVDALEGELLLCLPQEVQAVSGSTVVLTAFIFVL